MRRVGIREFRDNATKLLAAEEPLAVERRGTTVGYFIPVKKKDPKVIEEKLRKLEGAIEKVLAQTGWTEDELADYFTIRHPEREIR